MAEDNPFELADEKIDEIQKKISEPVTNRVETQQEIFSRVNGTGEIGAEAPMPQNTSENRSEAIGENTAEQNASVPKKPNIIIKNLRTFQGDVAEVIKRQNTSVLDIALAQQKKKQTEEKNAPAKNPETRKRVLAVSVSVVLVLLGVGAVAAFFLLRGSNSVPIASQVQNQTLLNFNQSVSIPVTASTTSDTLFAALNKERSGASINANEILYVALTQTSPAGVADPIDTNTFFSIVKNTAPSALLRAFGNTFMFGFYKEDTNEPFMLVTLDSYDNAFSGMLDWEKTMSNDIGALFLTPAALSDIGNGGAFEDETIKNKNTRVLQNNEGNTILLYSFLDKQTLLITTDETVLQVMVDKLAAQKLVR